MKFDRNQCDQIPSLTRLNSTASRHSNNNTSYSLVKSNLIKLETGCTVILHPIVSVLLLYLILKNGVAQIVLHISRSFAFDSLIIFCFANGFSIFFILSKQTFPFGRCQTDLAMDWQQCGQIGRFIGLWEKFKAFGNN